MSAVFAARTHAVGRWVSTRSAARAATPDHPAAAAAPPLARGDRICLRESSATGDIHLASRHALYSHPALAAPATWTRLGWEDVAAVGWSPLTSILRLSAWPQTGAASIAISLASRSSLPAFADEQMSASRLLTQRIGLPDGRQATVIARRAPGTATITWLVHLDPDADPTDDTLTRAITDALATLRAHCGF